MIPETEIKSVILNILSENNAISLATTGGEYSPWFWAHTSPPMTSRFTSCLKSQAKHLRT
jgi:hypothetical protein